LKSDSLVEQIECSKGAVDPGNGRAMSLKIEYRTGWIAGALVLLLSFWILRSFVVPLAWASIVALASWPVYRRFANRLPKRFASTWTPLLFTALVSLSVLGPIVFAFGALVAQARTWVPQLVAAEKQGLAPPGWLEDVPAIGGWLVDQWDAILGTPGGIALWLQRADARSIFGWAGSLGEFIGLHLFIVSFTVLALFFLYRDGEALAGRIRRTLEPRLGPRGAFYLDRAIVAVRATVYGTIVVGLIDGTLIGIAYALAGVPSAAVWGAVTGLFAQVPFLAYVAVAAVALALAAKGAGGAAFAVLSVGVVVVFATDKVARPLLVGGATKLGFLWVLLGSLGGLETLGFIGLFVGPVVLALAGTLLREWQDRSGLPAASGLRAAAAVDAPRDAVELAEPGAGELRGSASLRGEAR